MVSLRNTGIHALAASGSLSSTFTSGGASSQGNAGQLHNQLSYPSWQGSRTGEYGARTSPLAVSSDFSPYAGDHLSTLSSIVPSRHYGVGFNPYSDTSVVSGSTSNAGSSTSVPDSLKTDATASRTSGVESSTSPAPGVFSGLTSSLPSLPSIWSSTPPPAASSLAPSAPKDPSSQYTWTTSPTSKLVRSIVNDNRRNRSERTGEALRGILRTEGASTTVPDRKAKYTKEKSESLQIRAGSDYLKTRKHGKAALGKINKEWFENHSQTSGKSTRLSFADGTTDDRESTRKWRAERYLDPTLGSQVEADSIATYQSRVLRSAAEEARKSGMDSTAAETHLLSALAGLSGITYMLQSEVHKDKDYSYRRLCDSTAKVQSIYTSGIKSTHEDGRNENFKSFLRFMRATDTMLSDGVVQVKARNHREEIDWKDKKAVEAALRKYMSVYTGESTGVPRTKYTNSSRYKSGKSHKRLHDRRTRRDSDSE